MSDIVAPRPGRLNDRLLRGPRDQGFVPQPPTSRTRITCKREFPASITYRCTCGHFMRRLKSTLTTAWRAGGTTRSGGFTRARPLRCRRPGAVSREARAGRPPGQRRVAWPARGVAQRARVGRRPETGDRVEPGRARRGRARNRSPDNPLCAPDPYSTDPSGAGVANSPSRLPACRTAGAAAARWSSIPTLPTDGQNGGVVGRAS